jgi:hypothetical protein
MLRPRLLSVTFLATMALTSTSCTLTKPLVCAVTGPVVILGRSCDGLGCCGDPRGIVCVVVLLSAVGAAGGLVTGIISDIHWIAGDASDPTRNLGDPFATNTSAVVR